MKNVIKKYCLIFTLFLLTFSIKAQQNNFSSSANIGISTPILDNGIGFHIGLNPAYALHSHFSVEGQISYSYTKISGTFLSGNKGNISSINTLVGGRLYFNSEEKAARFYINFLLGGNYKAKTINNIDKGGEFGMSFSGGGYCEWNNLLIGAAYETPQNVVLKIGYVF
ncbi:MAG: hypothetical protein ACPG5B_00155 [Chitinophagales bacterium]